MELYNRLKEGLNSRLKDLCDQWTKVQPLTLDRENRLWQRLRLEWNYNSNHIEGNTLSYDETMLLLIHGRTAPGHHQVQPQEKILRCHSHIRHRG